MLVSDPVPLPFLAISRIRISLDRLKHKHVMVTHHRSGVFFQLLHEECDRLESLITDQSNRRSRSVITNAVLIMANVTNFSESTSVNDMLGIALEASSSVSKQSIVAIKPISPATRAWTNGSFSAFVKAGTSTLRLVLYPSVGPSLPTRIHAFVLMEASGSD